jgi:hypothetical protein
VFRWTKAEAELAAEWNPCALEGATLDDDIGTSFAPSDYGAHIVVRLAARVLRTAVAL